MLAYCVVHIKLIGNNGSLPATTDALTDMMYAIAKKVATPARISVKNLVPFLSYLCPENSKRNRLPITLLATIIFVFSTCEAHKHTEKLTGSVIPTQPMML
jgi:hypothetical protein